MRDLRELPKANLHLHLTGGMRHATLVELTAVHGMTVPPPLPMGEVQPWEAFQARYDARRAAIRGAEDIHRVITESIEDNLADGCTWLEIQVDPTSYAPLLGGYEPVVEVALDAMAGRPCGLIIASSWARSGAHATALAKVAARYTNVAGFGLSNDERRGDVADFAEAFRIATDAGLISVPHAGFFEEAWHVRACVDTLNARRIGHGITAMRDRDTVAYLAEKQVALEVCPTSYPPFGVASYESLPIRDLLDAGVPVALASDDPLLFGADVTAQYTIARDVIGLSDIELAAVAKHSIAVSTAPEDVKQRTADAIATWCAAVP
ncbi:adenosine deaminase [Kibdelosporangium persicum]|uniref:Aminodeoxyfutalosine deaminase n=1 Tax=Kibdelosporangium persicum TaxID=2698649 RepID=A0ABX2EX63_9PSEU|nr:adenosine deaminase [Kibdelosporangium persicum]NRN63302.1 Aminodeoxyfutalosine deaminase [Kibdelosporangium persicum]